MQISALILDIYYYLFTFNHTSFYKTYPEHEAYVYFLLSKLIYWTGLTTLAGWFWPTGPMLNTPVL